MEKWERGSMLSQDLSGAMMCNLRRGPARAMSYPSYVPYEWKIG